MALTPLLDFLKGAIGFSKADESEVGDDPEALRHLATHRRIVRLSAGLGGVGGLVSGIFLWIPSLAREAGGKMPDRDMMAYVVAPLMGVVAGILCGFSTSCLFVSRGFYQSPLGRRLLKITGTESVLLARIVGLVVAFLSGGMLIGPLVLPSPGRP